MKLDITLADGEVLRVDARLDRDEWNRRYRGALKRGNLIEIESARGEILAINPHQIKFVEYDLDTRTVSDVDAIPLRARRARRTGSGAGARGSA